MGFITHLRLKEEEKKKVAKDKMDGVPGRTDMQESYRWSFLIINIGVTYTFYVLLTGVKVKLF